MPQFGVYPSPSGNPDIAFVVQVQSSRLERSRGRVVIPLVRCSGVAPPDHPMTPRLLVCGVSVYANPLDLATIPATRLKTLLEVLPDSDQDRIMRAIDEVISRA